MATITSTPRNFWVSTEVETELKKNVSKHDLESLHSVASKLYEDAEYSDDEELLKHSESLARIGSYFQYGPSLNILGVQLSNKMSDPIDDDQIKRIEEIFLMAIELGESDGAYNLSRFYKDIGRLGESKKRLRQARAMGHEFALEEDDNFETINDNDPH